MTLCAAAAVFYSMVFKLKIICILFRFATILAFDVKVERDAQELADSLGVKIFQADIIYHLFDKFTAYREELKQKKREEFKNIAVFPCKLKVSVYFECTSVCPSIRHILANTMRRKHNFPQSASNAIQTQTQDIREGFRKASKQFHKKAGYKKEIEWNAGREILRTISFFLKKYMT